ncbi:MAG: 3-dehydroquinate synthase [Ruminococcaceae bacterium]|nr:3-dehydroquinate synthase [Oscillospiraceae bacterium]
MKTVRVNASKQYEVRIKDGLLKEAGQQILTVKKACSCVLVSDETVFSIYGETVVQSLQNAGFCVHTFLIPPGESSKSTANLVNLWEYLADCNITRSDLLVALGGGVVGDLTGFAAATFLRGIDFVQIPTTLLAMVDSSVGGKTAVDLQHGKNLAGAFYQPSLVLCDPSALGTLTPEIFADGMAEVIKYGFINRPELIEKLEKQADITDIITLCVEDKRDIVEQDERDNGCRQLLNLGHTLAHGIELHSGYTVSHGSAVAVGMVLITKAAVKATLCPQETLDILLNLLQKYNLPTKTQFTCEQLCEAALEDKKRKGSFITLVIPTQTGRSELKKTAIEDLPAFLIKAWDNT